MRKERLQLKVSDNTLRVLVKLKVYTYMLINYTVWYFTHGQILRFQKDLEKKLLDIDVTIKELKYYTRNMHEVLGQKTFEELMQGSPVYMFKQVYLNPQREAILWCNEVGYNYDRYHKVILKEFKNADGTLNEEKLQKNYLQLSEYYIEKLEQSLNKVSNDINQKNFVERPELITEAFTKSYKVYTNDEYCIIINRGYDDLNLIANVRLFNCKSSFYNPDSFIKNERIKSKYMTSPEEFFETLDYPEEFNQSTYARAASERKDEFLLYEYNISDVRLTGKYYIMESLNCLESIDLIEEMCSKKYLFIESTECRATKSAVHLSELREYVTVNTDDVLNYWNKEFEVKKFTLDDLEELQRRIKKGKTPLLRRT